MGLGLGVLAATAAIEAADVGATDPAPLEAGTLGRIRVADCCASVTEEDRLPFAFHTQAGELVGFDIEMGHALVRDMGVALSFARIDVARMEDLFDAGHVDVVMSSLAITPQGLERVTFSAPYLEQTLAFIVPDHRREAFRTADAVKALAPLKVGVPAVEYYATKLAS